MNYLLLNLKNIYSQKKGIELTLTMIVEFIIALIVLVILIIFFTGGFSENFGTLIGAGESGIDQAKNGIE